MDVGRFRGSAGDALHTCKKAGDTLWMDRPRGRIKRSAIQEVIAKNSPVAGASVRERRPSYFFAAFRQTGIDYMY